MKAVTWIVVGILVLVYLLVMFHGGQYWNSNIDAIDYPMRAFYHANVYHLLGNVVSFIALSFMEEAMGWMNYIFCIIFIWIVSSYILLFYHLIFPSRKVYTVGFSGVIFGLIVVYFSLIGKGSSITYLGLLISIIPQIFTIGISWEGHIAGIIAGLLFILLFPVKSKMIPNKGKASMDNMINRIMQGLAPEQH